MGLFSDKCEALIDVTTNRVLQGETLTHARQNPEAPRCGNRVPKAARFCNKCGSSAPGGWWKCHRCGKWVGAEANFCWNCKTALHPESRDAISDGVWQRQPGVFARHIRVAELRRLVEKGLLVEIGTVALLVEGGEIKATLEPGRHTLETLGRKFKGLFTTPLPQTVVLADAGDVVLPLRFTGVRTKEELPVECYTEVCFRFVAARGEAFLNNVLKSQDHLSYEGLADWMRQEIRGAVGDLVQSASIEDLVRDPQRRLRIEDALRSALAVALERAGVELVRVASVEFTGAEYEELRASAGQVEVKRRAIEFQQRMRELTTGDEMNRLKTEAELEEYVGQLAQEKGVARELQEHELARLKQVHRHELEKAEAAYQIAAELEQAAHEIQVKLHWDGYTRDKLFKDTELQEKIKQIESREDVRQTYEWLKVRAEKGRVDREAQKAQAELLAGHDIKTLIALLPDNAQRQQLLDLQRQTVMAGQSPEQILALAAASSPAAAAALAKMREVKREELEREFKDRKQLSDESVARLERVLSDALKAMAEYSRPKVTSTFPGTSGDPPARRIE
jgi:hypothetical protein